MSLIRPAADLNPSLAQALNSLDIGTVHIRSGENKEIVSISPRDHAKALFTYFNMAGYLSNDLLEKAVHYLASSKPFEREVKQVHSDLKNACTSSQGKNGKFDPEAFILQLSKINYLSADDFIDIIVFLQQTAFDRQFGVERDRLLAKSWMEENSKEFIEILTTLGVISPMPPTKSQYTGVGIMGAASVRVRKRLEFFSHLKIESELVWALSGNRELSKGLDEEKIMEEVAAAVGKPVTYVSKKIGADTREYLNGVTETMMVNFLIEKICPKQKIGIIDSDIQSGHWRATSAQNAADIAPILINKIQTLDISSEKDGQYHFLIIAEQPYPVRMAKQVQREFNKKIKQLGKKAISIQVEGCGAGVSAEDLSNLQALARINSELGSLMSERFNDYRYSLQDKPDLKLRNPKIIMFLTRDETFKNSQEIEAKQSDQSADKSSQSASSLKK